MGSTKEIELDIRIIAATNENLSAAAEEGEFREDLYHRLNEFSIEVPSLRDRRDDILLFADYFLARANSELDKNILEFSDETKRILQDYDWPGNLREMKNVIKRAVLFSETETMFPNALADEVVEGANKDEEAIFSKSDYEKERIMSALRQTNFNKSKAAKLLQITRKTLYNKINQYQLNV